MPKIIKVEGGTLDHLFSCPGCGCSHGFNTTWKFNGDFNNPTISPSLLVRWPQGDGKGNVKNNVCHSFIKDGKIQYLNDCTHELAGKTIELPELEL